MPDLQHILDTPVQLMSEQVLSLAFRLSGVPQDLANQFAQEVGDKPIAPTQLVLRSTQITTTWMAQAGESNLSLAAAYAKNMVILCLTEHRDALTAVLQVWLNRGPLNGP